jgi:RNA polymerase sigma-70 factor (ECF subfamily)
LLIIAWDGLSQREAAAALGCSRGAVALRLRRARKRLGRALLEIADEQQAGLRPRGGAAPCSTSPTTTATPEATR